MASFILIHGGFHDAWCWTKLIPELEKLGHSAIALDLPGRGSDKTPHGEITLDMWAHHLIEQARSEKQPIILVGHSLGGLTITRAAELAPELFDSLIYLSALVPPEGEAAMNPEALADEPLINIVNDGQTFTISNEAVGLLYNGCSAEDAAQAAARLCPEPIAPLATPFTTEGGFTRFRRTYIHCTLDKMLPFPWQQKVAERLECTQTITMETDHSPFLSAPQDLARNLASLV